MKTVFDKPNEQCQARLSIVVARKRGLKAKVFLLGAMVCVLGMMTTCKSGAACFRKKMLGARAIKAGGMRYYGVNVFQMKDRFVYNSLIFTPPYKM